MNKYETVVVDGVECPLGSLGQTIDAMQEMLETLRDNPAGIKEETLTYLKYITGNGLRFLRTFDEMASRFEDAQSEVLDEQLENAAAVGGVQ